MKEVRFSDYESFIYLNTHMTHEEARKYAVACWNRGLDQYEALAKATKEFQCHKERGISK